MSPDDVTPELADALWKLSDGREIPRQLLFDGMTPAHVDDMLEGATLRPVKRDTHVFEEGARADTFFLLLEGTVQIARTTPQGEQVIVRHVIPGELFGIAKAFGNDTYNTTARTVMDGLMLSWPEHLWDHFSQEYPDFLSASRQAVGKRFDDIQEKLVAMATLKVEQRIAHAILGLVKQAGMQTKEGTEINFPLTRQDISEMTGTTLHSVSRYMSKWQRSGILISKRRRVIVRQPEALPV